jgi:hypothetical protein
VKVVKPSSRTRLMRDSRTLTKQVLCLRIWEVARVAATEHSHEIPGFGEAKVVLEDSRHSAAFDPPNAHSRQDQAVGSAPMASTAVAQAGEHLFGVRPCAPHSAMRSVSPDGGQRSPRQGTMRTTPAHREDQTVFGSETVRAASTGALQGVRTHRRPSVIPTAPPTVVGESDKSEVQAIGEDDLKPPSEGDWPFPGAQQRCRIETEQLVCAKTVTAITE